MNKPDNVVYNYKTKKYDAYSKNTQPVLAESFTVDKIKKFKYEAQNHFISKIEEIKSEYDKLTE